MIELDKCVKENPESAIQQHFSIKYRQYCNLGELMYMLLYLSANAQANEEDEAFSIATEIFEKEILESLDEHDRCYIIIYILDIFDESFNKLPDCFSDVFIFKPNLRKVHNRLQITFGIDWKALPKAW